MPGNVQSEASKGVLPVLPLNSLRITASSGKVRKANQVVPGEEHHIGENQVYPDRVKTVLAGETASLTFSENLSSGGRLQVEEITGLNWSTIDYGS